MGSQFGIRFDQGKDDTYQRLDFANSGVMLGSRSRMVAAIHRGTQTGLQFAQFTKRSGRLCFHFTGDWVQRERNVVQLRRPIPEWVED